MKIKFHFSFFLFHFDPALLIKGFSRVLIKFSITYINKKINCLTATNTHHVAFPLQRKTCMLLSADLTKEFFPMPFAKLYLITWQGAMSIALLCMQMAQERNHHWHMHGGKKQVIFQCGGELRRMQS
jgi:hypothetical protein